MKKQVALVCGATGRVGTEITKTLARNNFSVAIHYHSNKTKAAALTKEIIKEGGEAGTFQADISDEMSVRKLFQAVNDELGELHVLVNAVHGQFDPKDIAEMSWEDWDTHIEALRGHFFLSKHVLPVMRDQHYGRIIFISGGLSKRFFRGCSAYTTIKAGLNAFYKTLALEEGQHNITVNIVAPGKVVTMDGRDSTDNPEAWEALNQQSISKSPLGRDATALDVAHAVRYFASKEAECITGQTLFVTGGEIMP